MVFTTDVLMMIFDYFLKHLYFSFSLILIFTLVLRVATLHFTTHIVCVCDKKNCCLKNVVFSAGLLLWIKLVIVL